MVRREGGRNEECYVDVVGCCILFFVKIMPACNINFQEITSLRLRSFSDLHSFPDAEYGCGISNTNPSSVSNPYSTTANKIP